MIFWTQVEIFTKIYYITVRLDESKAYCAPSSIKLKDDIPSFKAENGKGSKHLYTAIVKLCYHVPNSSPTISKTCSKDMNCERSREYTGSLENVIDRLYSIYSKITLNCFMINLHLLFLSTILD